MAALYGDALLLPSEPSAAPAPAVRLRGSEEVELEIRAGQSCFTLDFRPFSDLPCCLFYLRRALLLRELFRDGPPHDLGHPTSQRLSATPLLSPQQHILPPYIRQCDDFAGQLFQKLRGWLSDRHAVRHHQKSYFCSPARGFISHSPFPQGFVLSTW